MDVALWVWIAFGVFLISALLIDLLVLHRDAHVVSMREATIMSAVWISIGLLFGLLILVFGNATSAGEYYAGFLIEKALSVDNVFVFALLFGYFAVPAQYQHRVLFWGVIGALVLRLVFILAGIELLERFDWVVYLFGALLIVTGIRMARHQETEVDPERNPIVKLVRKRVRMTEDYEGQKFFTRRNGVLMATPLLLVLVTIETTDVIFAVDSIPAILSITTDTFIVFTSNAFALLGLRALYFLLAGAMREFAYLQIGLALILVFVGAKFIYGDLFGKVPVTVSLPVIIGVLTVSIVASILKDKRDAKREVAA